MYFFNAYMKYSILCFYYKSFIFNDLFININKIIKSMKLYILLLVSCFLSSFVKGTYYNAANYPMITDLKACNRVGHNPTYICDPDNVVHE